MANSLRMEESPWRNHRKNTRPLYSKKRSGPIFGRKLTNSNILCTSADKRERGNPRCEEHERARLGNRATAATTIGISCSGRQIIQPETAADWEKNHVT